MSYVDFNKDELLKVRQRFKEEFGNDRPRVRYCGNLSYAENLSAAADDDRGDENGDTVYRFVIAIGEGGDIRSTTGSLWLAKNNDETTGLLVYEVSGYRLDEPEEKYRSLTRAIERLVNVWKTKYLQAE